MLFTIILIAISVCFFMISWRGKELEPGKKTEKLTKGLAKVMPFIPILVFVIFCILFCTVLQGRFIERSSHAFLVFMLWMYGTSFYVYFLKYFKNKMIAIVSIVGFLVAVLSAIILTPLDRYCELMFYTVHEFSYLIGVIMMGLWYFCNWKFTKHD